MTIGFEETAYSIIEGDPVDVTVSVMVGTLTGDVVVTVTSADDTAGMLQ